MPGCSRNRSAALLLLLLLTSSTQFSETTAPGRTTAPAGEVLQYRAEWRLVNAGNVRLTWTRKRATGGWQADLSLQSAGLVSMLYKVDDRYTAQIDEKLCAASSVLTALEGSRRRETKVTFDSHRRKASYLERDMKKGVAVSTREIDIPGCVHDIVAGLYQLRGLRLEPGKQIQLPVSDGKKSILARVDAQERETIGTPAGKFKTVRYEAFLFNDVLYRRKGRLFIWLTDDERRLPVQFRVRLQFPIGTITLLLEKAESI